MDNHEDTKTQTKKEKAVRGLPWSL